MKRRMLCRLSRFLSLLVYCSTRTCIKPLTIIVPIVVLSGVFGCAKTYRMELKKPTGEMVYSAEFESYKWGDTTYSASASWYPDGKIQSMTIQFSRNISTLWQQIADGLSKMVGAAGNKF